jgi:succinoglycan biosynthesis transport protein ExoP
VLPCLGATSDRVPGPETLSSPAFAESIRSLRAHYDLIILDLAPFSKFADLSSVTPLLDTVLVVAQWGKTPARFLEELLESHPDLDERVLGLILNKANVSQMGRM